VATKTIHGKAYGKRFALDEDLGVSDGQDVEVQVTLITEAVRQPGDGFLRTEGALAALVHSLALVTHNTADDQKISGLHLEDWYAP
jgi:hypothetical protein